VASSARWPAWRQLRKLRKTMTSMFSMSETLTECFYPAGHVMRVEMIRLINKFVVCMLELSL
jgi:hypothetical protein